MRCVRSKELPPVPQEKQMKMHEPHQQHGVFCIFRLIISLVFLGILSLIGEPVLSDAEGSVDCLHLAADRRFSYCELPKRYESLISSGSGQSRGTRQARQTA